MNHYSVVFVHRYDNFKCTMDVYADSELEALSYASSLPDIYEIIEVRPWHDPFELTEEQKDRIARLHKDLTHIVQSAQSNLIYN